MSDDRTMEEHPSYGLLSVHRVSGGNNNLFGSNLTHHHTIRLTINRGVMYRNLHQKWYYETDELIEVEMSPIQWAEAITNLNHCPGTCCTIKALNNKLVESPPSQLSVTEEYNKDFTKSMAKLAEKMGAHAGEIKTLLAEKKSLGKEDRKKINGFIERMMMELQCNVPFIHAQFEEAVEGTVAQAKGEIEAFMHMAADSHARRIGCELTVPTLDYKEGSCESSVQAASLQQKLPPTEN